MLNNKHLALMEKQFTRERIGKPPSVFKTSRNPLKRYSTVLLVIFSIAFQNFAIAQEQQGITITGVVLDPQGLPLPAVNVSEKNTNNGLQTDFDGNFSITVDSKKSILVFSYVGMRTTEVTVGERTTIDIQMDDDPQSLDEVVIVGYGKQKKISVVGAQSTIEAEELELPVANIGTMLAGRISGLTCVQRDGIPGFD